MEMVKVPKGPYLMITLLMFPHRFIRHDFYKGCKNPVVLMIIQGDEKYHPPSLILT